MQQRSFRDAAVRPAAMLDAPAALTRRAACARMGALSGVLAVLAAHPARLDGKRKKKKGKGKRKKPQPLRISDWLGNWRTTLDNGVRGTASFVFDTALGRLEGAYSNTVGTGEFVCVLPASGTSLSCSYTQTDDQTGSFEIDLTDKNHWDGTYQIDGASNGTWSGVRQ